MEQQPQPSSPEQPGLVNRLKSLAALAGLNIQLRGRQPILRSAGRRERTPTTACHSSCMQRLETSAAIRPAPQEAPASSFSGLAVRRRPCTLPPTSNKRF